MLRIGGDHFEYRPLDFYWPLLAVPASMGIVHLGSRIATGQFTGKGRIWEGSFDVVEPADDGKAER